MSHETKRSQELRAGLRLFAESLLEIDIKLQEEDVVDQIRISMERSAVEHLVLVADIDIEILIKGLVDTKKESVLIDSGPGPLASTSHVIDAIDGIEINKYFVVPDNRPVRGHR